MKQFRLLTLLALLLTAATGAWATTPNSIVINGTPLVGDKSISLTYHFDPNNVPGLEGYAPTLKVKCAADNKWDEVWLSLTEISSGTTNISLSTLGEFEAGKTYEVCFAYNNGDWVDEVFQSFVPATAASSAPKHLIKATYRERTRSLEQPLPYATTIGELFEAVTGEPFSDLISTMSSMEMPLTGISSNNTSAVSIGELNGASTPVTVNADGKATISINFGSYAYGIFVSAISPLYAKMKDGVKDADKWTVKVGDGQAQALPIGGLTGDGTETVTLQYNGRLKVKGVKATSDEAPEEPAVTWNTVDLSTLTENTELKDGDVLTGTLPGNYKITIADGATVMLDGAVINGANDESCQWAGLTLAGDGTIILSGENSVKGFYENYPGIFVPANKTLTIQGDGSLTATGGPYSPGIGGGYQIACGNIVIEGGTVTATGGRSSAGIGGGRSASCGNISITGGTVTATGGAYSPGIGGGYSASCGNITIANTVTKVTATKGNSTTNSIGASKGGSCGTVTIGGNVTGNISTSPYTYQPSN